MDTEPTWSWDSVRPEHPPGDAPDHAPDHESDTTRPPRPEEQPAPGGSNPNRRRRYGPRTCRICLETVHPKYPSATTSIGMSSPFRPVYMSEDPELGRLLSPCKCKGTQKYVHEGCLNAWRASSPAQERNFWHCPTCGYTYKLARLQWASLLGSRITQALLTLVVFAIGIFFLGFVADPVFNLWLDPVGTIGDALIADEDEWDMPFEEPATWTEHFVKGFFSLGIVGLLKSALLMSPWHWWHFRGGGGRRRGNGRGRVENLSLLFVLLGAFAALKGIWKLVRALSARVLLKMRDRVLDVGGDDDDEEPQRPGGHANTAPNGNERSPDGEAKKDR